MTSSITTKLGYFLCNLLIFLFITTLQAHAKKSDSKYHVQGVIANAVADDPFQARKVAIADARRRAFKIMLQNLEIKANADELFDDQEISDTIRSQQVEGERIAGNEYFASLNIIFDQDFIDHAILQKNLKDFEQNKKAENYLILPAKKVDNQIYFWSEANNWKTAIINNLQNSRSKIYKTVEPSIDNLTLLDEAIFIEPKFQDIAEIANRYDADSAYSLIFSYNKIKHEAYVDITYLQNIHRKRIRLNFVNANALEENELLDIVAKKTIQYLNQQDHKIDFADDGKKYIGIPITSLGHWLMIKNKLESATFLNGLEIKTISRDFVVIAAFYDKNQALMESDFLSIGLIVNRKSFNYFSAITMN